MQHVFRVTYLITSYMEVDLVAESCREAEALFEAAATGSAHLATQAQPLGRPQQRIVDICAVRTPPLALQPEKVLAA